MERRGGAAAAVRLFLVAATAAQVVCVADQSDCAWKGYDLSPMYGEDLNTDAGSYTYKLAVCGTVKDQRCAQSYGAFCQYTLPSPPVFSAMLAQWDNTGSWSLCTNATGCPNGGVQVADQNGDSCVQPSAPQVSTFVFACDPTSDSMVYTVTITARCTYRVLFSNRYGCPVSSSTGTAEAEDSGEPLSGGAVAGIAIGTVAGAALSLAVVWWFACGRRERSSAIPIEESGPSGGVGTFQALGGDHAAPGGLAQEDVPQRPGARALAPSDSENA